MSRRILVTLLAALILLVTAGVTWAQTSPNYDLSWHVVSAGGRERMTSGTSMVHGTLSQFAIGPASSGQTAVGSGYWYGIRLAQAVYLYIPLLFNNFTFP